MKPTHWQIELDGTVQPQKYFQRAAANGAAMIFRGQGRRAVVVPYGY